MKRLSYFQPFILLFILLLAACENVTIVSRTGVSVDTNAYYTAYQKDPTGPWQQINFKNNEFKLETLTFTVDEPNDPYAVVFVCPSKRRDQPHEVYVYYATAAEMTLLDFKCRKSADDIIKRPLYGKISGVNPASLTNPANAQGELVKLALSSTASLTVLEAYAAEVVSGRRDAVAYKGKQSLTGNFIESPETFYIYRGFAAGLTSEPEKLDFGFGAAYGGYTADFDVNKTSNVIVTGQNGTDSVSAEVSFLSRNKSSLSLVKTNQPTFSFIPVPLDEFTTGDIGGFFNVNEFNPGEGHELSATIESSAGKIEREVRKFFTLSDKQTHTINLPKAIDFLPALKLNNNDKYQYINTAWSEYTDAASGKTQLYRWVFEGSAAKLPENAKPEVNVTKLKWNIHITPGWMNNVSRTPGSFALTLPIKYEANVVRDGATVAVWSDDWSFQNNTPVSWELAAFTASDQGSSGAVIEYLLNRNIVENYTFTQSYMRSSISPSP